MTINNDVATEVARYLARYNFGQPPEFDQDIFALGTVTSMVGLQILMFIEKRWAIKVPNGDLKRENFRSVAAIAQLVERFQNVEAA